MFEMSIVASPPLLRIASLRRFSVFPIEAVQRFIEDEVRGNRSLSPWQALPAASFLSRVYGSACRDMGRAPREFPERVDVGGRFPRLPNERGARGPIAWGRDPRRPENSGRRVLRIRLIDDGSSVCRQASRVAGGNWPDSASRKGGFPRAVGGATSPAAVPGPAKSDPIEKYRRASVSHAFRRP